MNVVLKYILTALSLLLIGLLIGLQISGMRPSFPRYGQNGEMDKLEETVQFIEQNYVEEPEHDLLVEAAIEGMLKGLDPHSFYIPPAEMARMEEQLEGGFDGIGIQFNIIDDTIYVERPIAGGPSEAVGIQAGDRIVTVNGENVAGIDISNDKVVELFKGQRGTEVAVQIVRRGVPELIDMTIERDRIPVSSIEYSYLIQDKIGYIKVSRFSENTHPEFREALLALKEQGMENLILDLRGNPGGLMNMAYKIADEFLTAGEMIVSTKGRTPISQQEHFATSLIGSFEHGPLIVLIDYNSASASEIVAGAVQDHDRGLIVGVRSFGKGLVQVPKKFDDNSAIRLVISKYYTPSGRCIQKPYDEGEELYQEEILRRFESGELFDESKIEFPDSLTYFTDAGRKVYGGGGISPDVFVPLDTMGNSAYLQDLQQQDLLRVFAFTLMDGPYGAQVRATYPTSEDFVRGFSIDNALFQRFTRFAADRGVPYRAAEAQASKPFLLTYLKAFMGRHLYQSDDAFYPVLHQHDNQLEEALHLLPVAGELEESGKVELALRQ